MCKKLLTIKKILIMMLCVIVSLLSIVSCTKDELSFDQNNQTDNLTDVQARIGNIEGTFEYFENIESYKDFRFESNDLYNKHQLALNLIKKIDKFPSVENNTYSLQELTQLLYMNSKRVQEIPEGYETNLYYDYHNEKSFINNYNLNNRVKPYVELIFEIDRNSHYLSDCIIQSPSFNCNFFNSEDRKKVRFYGLNYRNKHYFTRYIEKDKYCELTGINKELIDNLRIMTFTRLQIFNDRPDFEKNLDDADICHYIYQFPYQDNYLDYRNESLKSDTKLNLKQYIKPGACIFVFDKTFDKLDDHDLVFDRTWGHMMIVSDYYQETKSDQYIDLDQYKRLGKNQDFVEIDALRKDMYDDNISFEDYLKHFVFIEAIKDVEYDNNKVYFDKRSGVIFSSGNDKIIQDNFRNKYTVISVSNLNKGIKMYNTEVQHLFLNYIRDAAFKNKKYDWYQLFDEKSYPNYCSGLVYFGYSDDYKYGIKILNKDQSQFAGLRVWYMPRTVTNSPFMYTRIWYNR